MKIKKNQKASLDQKISYLETVAKNTLEDKYALDFITWLHLVATFAKMKMKDSGVVFMNDIVWNSFSAFRQGKTHALVALQKNTTRSIRLLERAYSEMTTLPRLNGPSKREKLEADAKGIDPPQSSYPPFSERVSSFGKRVRDSFLDSSVKVIVTCTSKTGDLVDWVINKTTAFKEKVLKLVKPSKGKAKVTDYSDSDQTLPFGYFKSFVSRVNSGFSKVLSGLSNWFAN